MSMQTNFQRVLDDLQVVQAFIRDNSDKYDFWDMVDEVYTKLQPIREFARENIVPIVLDEEEIVRNAFTGHIPDSYESSYYEEYESSSYY